MASWPAIVRDAARIALRHGQNGKYEQPFEKENKMPLPTPTTSSFKWTDLIPSFIGAGGERAEQQLELLRKIYNQDIRLSRNSEGRREWLDWWEPGREDRVQ